MYRTPVMILAGVALGIALWDAWCVYGRRWTLYYLLTGTAFAVLRANAVGWVIGVRHQSAPALPYAVNQPLVTLFGASLLEIAGWLLVAHLGWRLAGGILPRAGLFHRVLTAGLFIGAASYAVETTAIALDWWKWYVPLGDSLFGKVPAVGVIDWAFVALDFLLPFTAFALVRGKPWLKALSLLAFPLHMASHLRLEFLSAGFPLSLNDLAHILLPGVLAWAGFLQRPAEGGDAPPPGRAVFASLGVVAATLLVLNLAVPGPRARLLSLVPLALFALLAAPWPRRLPVAAALACASAAVSIMGLPALIPVGWAALLRGVERLPKGAARLALGALPLAALLAVGWVLGGRLHAKYEAILAFNDQIRSGRLEEARGTMERILEKDPLFSKANHTMAVYYLERRDPARAEEHLLRSLEGMQYYLDSVLALLQLYMDTGREGEALTLWEKAHPFHEDHPEMNYFGFLLHNARGDGEGAAPYLQRALELSSLTHYPRLYLSVLTNLDRGPEAEREAWRCLREGINPAECGSFLFDWYTAQGRTEKLQELEAFFTSPARPPAPGSGQPPPAPPAP